MLSTDLGGLIICPQVNSQAVFSDKIALRSEFIGALVSRGGVIEACPSRVSGERDAGGVCDIASSRVVYRVAIRKYVYPAVRRGFLALYT